ncbi:MAG: glycerophosphodiester phosphodiesterase [Actinomycetota bacterium]|nr:glycerophosphodiester phosphodiesterase [Actinomycetota bacterium]
MLVLAHRGCPTPQRPENTVAAVQAALDGAADGVEIDVRRTLDGVLVCSHDADLLRLTGRPMAVATTRAEEIRAVPLAGGHRLATLDEVLAKARGRLVIEAKPVTGPNDALRTAMALCLALETAPPGPAITVSSFDADLLATIRFALRHAARPHMRTYVRTALLGAPGTSTRTLLRRTLDGRHDEMHPHVSDLLRAPHLVAVAHTVGASVTCWTVNRRKDVRRLARLGVDAVISDRPATARTAAATAMIGARAQGSNL